MYLVVRHESNRAHRGLWNITHARGVKFGLVPSQEGLCLVCYIADCIYWQNKIL